MPPRKKSPKKPQSKRPQSKQPSKKAARRKPAAATEENPVDRGEEKRSKRGIARAAAAVLGLGIAVRRVLRKR